MYGSIVLAPKISAHGAWWPSVKTIDGLSIFGVKDYSNASRSGRGVVVYYALPPGAYIVHEISSWKHSRDYLIVVRDDGEIEEVDERQAKEIFRNQCS